MNRRQAIQKLAASGAIAAGGSVLLSSTDVAYAASPPGTGLTGVPGPTDPLPIQVSFNANGTITLSDSSSPSCASGGAVNTTYAWTIQSVYLGNARRTLHLLNASNGAVIGTADNKKGCTNCPRGTGSTGVDSVTLRKNNNGGNLQPLDAGDTFSLVLQVSWYCSGAAKAVTAEYMISGSGSSVSPPVPISYSVA